MTCGARKICARSPSLVGEFGLLPERLSACDTGGIDLGGSVESSTMISDYSGWITPVAHFLRADWLATCARPSDPPCFPPGQVPESHADRHERLSGSHPQLSIDTTSMRSGISPAHPQTPASRFAASFTRIAGGRRARWDTRAGWWLLPSP